MCRLWAWASVVCTALAWPDCNGAGESQLGSFAPLAFYNITWDDKIFYVQIPTGDGPWPLVVFMHGLTGAFEQWAFPPGQEPNASTWYARPLDIYATHGFVTIFPHIKGPIEDQNSSTAESDGTSIKMAIAFATAAQSNESSPLYGMVDLDNVAIAGHSMGSGDVIRVAAELPVGALKFAAIQHPAPCAPWGWQAEVELRSAGKFPLIMTTSTNDGAFWPAPQTADKDHECFMNATLQGPAAFLQFTGDACAETHKSEPWEEEGHDCSFKPNVETPWVLRGLKLYLQQGGDASSKCAQTLWGSGPDSPQNDPNIDVLVTIPSATMTAV